MSRPLIAIDWGTSSLRGARLSPDGRALEERAFSRGIMSVPAGGFTAVFDELFGDWMAAMPDALCLISGMGGSRQGWLEAPYGTCPSDAAALASQLAWIEPDRLAIVPGLSCLHRGTPDVMRGEETQVFGAMRLLGLDSGRFVLPGTHSKWVTVRAGRIVEFTTAMTGEVYGLLRRDSILARTLPADDGDFDGAAFDAGVSHALGGVGLLQSAFSVRTLSLFERLPESQGPSYLSGIVIGEELRSQSASGAGRVVVIGAEALTRRYRQAFASVDVDALTVGSEATWSGLSQIAETLLS